MAFKNVDRVRDTTTSNGTGDIAVSGSAPVTYQNFGTAFSVGDTFWGCIAAFPAANGGSGLNEWEVGRYTYSALNTITRTQVLASSAGGTTSCTFTAGLKDIFTVPVGTMSNGGLEVGGPLNVTPPTGVVHIGANVSDSQFLYIDAGVLASGVGGCSITKTRDAVNAHAWTWGDVGGLTGDAGGGAFWRGFHIAGPIITDPVGGANLFPRVSLYYEYNSLSAPTTRNFVFEAGNDTSTSAHTFIWRNVAGELMRVDAAGLKINTGGASPLANDGGALGTTALKWSDLFLASGAVINFNSGDVTITHSTDNLAFAGGTVTLTAPASDPANGIDTFALMVGGNFGGGIGFQDSTGNVGMWTSGVGANFNFGFGASLGALVASLTLTSAALTPAANDGTALGTTTLKWSDLFLASGGVINWNSGAITLTQIAANQASFMSATGMQLGVGTTNPTDVLQSEATDAAGNTVLGALRVARSSTSGSFAAGIGVKINYQVQTAAATFVVGGNTAVVASDVAAGTQDFDFLVQLMAAGATAADRLRISSTNVLTLGTAGGGNKTIIMPFSGGETCSIQFGDTSNQWSNVFGGDARIEAYHGMIIEGNTIGSGTSDPCVMLQSNGATGLSMSKAGAITIANAPLTLTGGQIAFPGTQNASSNVNTLDDYEEGTWTPTIQFGGASVGITYSVQTGHYVKIGKMVWIGCRLELSNKGSSTGSARLAGLPFQTDTAPAGWINVVPMHSYNWNTITATPLFQLTDTQTTAELKQPFSDNNLDNTHFQNGTVIRFSATYRASA